MDRWACIFVTYLLHVNYVIRNWSLDLCLTEIVTKMRQQRRRMYIFRKPCPVFHVLDFAYCTVCITTVICIQNPAILSGLWTKFILRTEHGGFILCTANKTHMHIHSLHYTHACSVMAKHIILLLCWHFNLRGKYFKVMHCSKVVMYDIVDFRVSQTGVSVTSSSSSRPTRSMVATTLMPSQERWRARRQTRYSVLLINVIGTRGLWVVWHVLEFRCGAWAVSSMEVFCWRFFQCGLTCFCVYPLRECFMKLRPQFIDKIGKVLFFMFLFFLMYSLRECFMKIRPWFCDEIGKVLFFRLGSLFYGVCKILSDFFQGRNTLCTCTHPHNTYTHSHTHTYTHTHTHTHSQAIRLGCMRLFTPDSTYRLEEIWYSAVLVNSLNASALYIHILAPKHTWICMHVQAYRHAEVVTLCLKTIS